MSGAKVFTIERSHDGDRLIPPRPTDLGTLEAERDRSDDHAGDGRFAPGNRAGARRGAKRALRRAYTDARERIRNALSEAAGAGTDVSALPTADKILADAFDVHLAGMAELGSRSVFVQGQCLVYAAESVLHGFYLEAAARAGLLTEEGQALHAHAGACATLASRAMTAAIAATKALGERRKPALSYAERYAARKLRESETKGTP